MVKNTTGGNKSKALARKNIINKKSNLRFAQEEGEIYAQAIKVMGGNIVSAIDINGNELICHIRGKFRGSKKRDNFISPNSWLLVGLHNWENNSKTIKNCDILEVYTEQDKTILKNSITSIDWNKFISNDNKIFSDCKEDNLIVFSDLNNDVYEKIIGQQMLNKQINIIEEEINVDDI